MELITHLERHGGKFSAVGIGSSATRAGYCVEDLGLNGLPEDASSRRRTETDFANWEQASLSEYGHAFGLNVLRSEGHDVWAFPHNGTRFVVPALALMRALFRPMHSLMPHLYRPQSLEDICTYVGGEANIRVALTGGVRDWSGSPERASLAEPVSWMFSFPSARAMWSSVLTASHSSKLGLELPKASVRMVVHGIAHGKNFYVTRVVLVRLTALDEPFEFADNHPREISFHVSDERLANGFKSNRTKDDSIKLRDGESSLSDQEWAEIAPAINLGKKFKHNPRSIVDAMLAKQSQGTSWTDTAYAPGIDFATVSIAFHRWKKDGRWAKVLEVLEETRADD